LTGGNAVEELGSWECRTRKLLGDACVWAAVCQLASSLDGAEVVGGEGRLSGTEVTEILASLIPNERKAALGENAFG
jgi:hypothetical protein